MDVDRSMLAERCHKLHFVERLSDIKGLTAILFVYSTAAEGSVWDRCVSGVESAVRVWDQCGIGVGSVWDQCGISVGSEWDQCGISVGSA